MIKKLFLSIYYWLLTVFSFFAISSFCNAQRSIQKTFFRKFLGTLIDLVHILFCAHFILCTSYLLYFLLWISFAADFICRTFHAYCYSVDLLRQFYLIAFSFIWSIHPELQPTYFSLKLFFYMLILNFDRLYLYIFYFLGLIYPLFIPSCSILIMFISFGFF